MSFQNLKLESQDGVAVLTLDRPKALNALNSETLKEIAAAVGVVAKDSSLRTLIVTGAGEKAFVAGADIAEMAQFTTAQAETFVRLGREAFTALEGLRIPTIAAVNGFALGGGLELALACDLLYASEKALMGLPEVGLSVIPGFGGTQRLTRRVGRARAKELIFTGERISAQVAKSYGLALEVLPPEQLLPHCRAVAAKIAKGGPLAIAEAKRAIERGADLDLPDALSVEHQAFAYLFGTQDQKEGMKAFLEKRAPLYAGK